jgi:hypothetical protein
MAIVTLEALVLRGVAVVRDGMPLNLRLGASVVAGPRAPEIAPSTRRPSPRHDTRRPESRPKNNFGPDFGQAAGWAPHADDCVMGTAHGAGRPLDAGRGAARALPEERHSARRMVLGATRGKQGER